MKMLLVKRGAHGWFKGLSPTGRQLFTQDWQEARFFSESEEAGLLEFKNTHPGASIYEAEVQEPVVRHESSVPEDLGSALRGMNLQQGSTAQYPSDSRGTHDGLTVLETDILEFARGEGGSFAPCQFIALKGAQYYAPLREVMKAMVLLTGRKLVVHVGGSLDENGHYQLTPRAYDVMGRSAQTALTHAADPRGTYSEVRSQITSLQEKILRYAGSHGRIIVPQEFMRTETAKECSLHEVLSSLEDLYKQGLVRQDGSVCGSSGRYYIMAYAYRVMDWPVPQED